MRVASAINLFAVWNCKLRRIRKKCIKWEFRAQPIRNGGKSYDNRVSSEFSDPAEEWANERPHKLVRLKVPLRA
jgi:hypothetical protein